MTSKREVGAAVPPSLQQREADHQDALAPIYQSQQAELGRLKTPRPNQNLDPTRSPTTVNKTIATGRKSLLADPQTTLTQSSPLAIPEVYPRFISQDSACEAFVKAVQGVIAGSDVLDLEQVPSQYRPWLEFALDMKRPRSQVILTLPAASSSSRSADIDSWRLDSSVKKERIHPSFVDLIRRPKSSSTESTLPNNGRPVITKSTIKRRGSECEFEVSPSAKRRRIDSWPPPACELDDIHEHLASTRKSHQGCPSKDQRLELLGDAVLHYILTVLLYKELPLADEGQLTGMRVLLENNCSLANFARMYNMDDLLERKEKEKKKESVRSKRLADIFEAYIGGLFLEKGIDTVNSFITELMMPIVQHNKWLEVPDPHALSQLKTKLGPERTNNLRFEKVDRVNASSPIVVACMIAGSIIGQGCGLAFSDARLRAAMAALREIDRCALDQFEPLEGRL